MKTIIYGLRAAGKDTITDAIVERTEIKQAHLDQLVLAEIQRKYPRCKTITEFVDVYSLGQWSPFRDIEHLVLKGMLANPSIEIASLGGGTAAYDRNRHIIDPVNNYLLNPHQDKDARNGILERVFNRGIHPKDSISILLDVSLEEQRKRLELDFAGKDNRPDLGKSLEDIYTDRIGNYRNFADITVQVDGKTIDKIVDEILGNTQIQESIKIAA